MTTEHTPGPWVRSHNVVHEPTIIAADMTKHPTPNGSHIIAQTYGPDKHINADFLAAAPETAAERDRLKSINLDLLAALLALSNAVDIATDAAESENFYISDRITSQVDAAIKRATEETPNHDP